MKKEKYIKIYARYLEAKESGSRIGDLLTEFKISRQTLYDIIRRIQVGDIKSTNRCLKQGRLECLWEHRYKTLFLSLPKNRSASTVAGLRRVIWRMKNDKFPIYVIADKLGKTRSTILHHLAKTK